MTAPTTPGPTPEGLKAAHRDMWADGDYATVATHITTLTDHLVRRLGDVAGRDVLDVATGTGNVALELAGRGARVTGLDLVEELLAVARHRSAEAGVDVAWVCGDAEALPFADASFDVVTSVVGIQFAPRHELAAAELLRVTRPGGTIALANWTPEGLIGRMFGVMGRHLPTPPAFVSPPPRWGDEAHVRALLGDAVDDLAFERASNAFRFPSLDEYMAFFEQRYGPTIAARARLGDDGWQAAQDELRTLYEELGRTDAGAFVIEAEYVLVTARRR
jgi:SAM-dependent methyltransferase